MLIPESLTVLSGKRNSKELGGPEASAGHPVLLALTQPCAEDLTGVTAVHAHSGPGP